VISSENIEKVTQAKVKGLDKILITIMPTVIASENTVMLAQTTVICLLEGLLSQKKQR
jgi:hypothetical protein